MLNKVRSLLSGKTETKTEYSYSVVSSARALTVEETLMLASGIDLKAILHRKKNQVYIRKPLNIARQTTGILSRKQLPNDSDESDAQSSANNSKKLSKVAKSLEGSHTLYSEKVLKNGKVVPDRLPTNGTTQTSHTPFKKNIECIHWSSIGSFLEPSLLMTSGVAGATNTLHQQAFYDRRDVEKTIFDIKRRFFMTVPKPIMELRINWKTSVVSGHSFTLPDYYQPIKFKGKGPNAIVIEAIDRRSARIIAIKKYNGFMNHTGSAKRILRELKLWMWFDHQDVCKLLDVVPVLHKNIFTFENIYIVIELMDADLGRVLRTRNLKKSHCQTILYQLLRCLKYLHSGNVVHNNLKPQNVLLQVQETNTKITDFGYSQPSGIEGVSITALTAHVSPLWYRSPEICLCSRKYGKPSDIWSLGCIFAEMYRNAKPLFQGSSSHRKQLKTIFSKLGKPSVNWVENSQALSFIQSLPFKEPTPLELHCPGICPDGVDLLSGLLKPDPRERITVERALEHPFVASVRDRSTERECQPFEVGYERDLRVKSTRGLRMMFYETIDEWRKRCKF